MAFAAGANEAGWVVDYGVEVGRVCWVVAGVGASLLGEGFGVPLRARTGRTEEREEFATEALPSEASRAVHDGVCEVVLVGASEADVVVVGDVNELRKRALDLS